MTQPRQFRDENQRSSRAAIAVLFSGYESGFADLTVARAPTLKPKMSLPTAAHCVLLESFSQFTTNLHLLRVSDDSEVVHQARIGWRRFRTVLRLFKKISVVQSAPPWEPLKPILVSMGSLHDMDVARGETLPQFAHDYAGTDPGKQGRWRAMEQALLRTADDQRQAVRVAMDDTAVQETLLTITQWLGNKAAWKKSSESKRYRDKSLRQWAKRQVACAHEQLQTARRDCGTFERQHRTRILAKRWYQQAIDLQMDIGTTRDVMQAATIASTLGADPELVAFLRNAAEPGSAR
uniref:Adenylate cyclase n=1 Tax=uncultured bacterium fCS1 TaxID=585280 RepID=C3U0Q7_9BACT|nr:adenylate cyclase [uncultured bacterium fCS1]